MGATTPVRPTLGFRLPNSDRKKPPFSTGMPLCVWPNWHRSFCRIQSALPQAAAELEPSEMELSPKSYDAKAALCTIRIRRARTMPIRHPSGRDPSIRARTTVFRPKPARHSILPHAYDGSVETTGNRPNLRCQCGNGRKTAPIYDSNPERRSKIQQNALPHQTATTRTRLFERPL